MPRPKKWFLAVEDEDNSGDGAQRYLVVKSTDGLLKKPYASEPLGRIKDVSFNIISRVHNILITLYHTLINCIVFCMA